METFLASQFGHSILKRSHKERYRQTEEFMSQKLRMLCGRCSRRLESNAATALLETR